MFCIKFISSLIKATERITTKPGTQQQSQAEQLVNEWVLERVEANFKEILEFLSKGIMLPSQIKLKLFHKNYRVMFFFKIVFFPWMNVYICWNWVEKRLKLMFQSIINSHPYHVDALLQLSELCRLSEDLPMAAELIERALYCLECAFHPSFNFAQGNCRLDYRKQENR